MGEFLTAAAEDREPTFPEVLPIELEGEFQFDKREDGWKLESDVGFSPPITSLNDLTFYRVLHAGERQLIGDAFIQRAIEYEAVLGQRHLEWLFTHKDELSHAGSIVGVGTIWRSGAGERKIPIIRDIDCRHYLFSWISIDGAGFTQAHLLPSFRSTIAW